MQKYIPFFASALLMCLLLVIIYPHYQYYIDPDGTAYLTISQRYANGDYFKAINGYWSPWSCWLTAILIKVGLQPIPASVVINALGATGILFISQSFFLRLSITRKLQWLLNTTLALFLCYAIFWQSFDDLWECFFLLSTLRIILVEDFRNKPALWIACGFIGTLAYFAKAYSFPFFILNVLCCTYFICKDNKVQWLKISFIAITVMVVCSLPWIWLLRAKYNIWTTSTAGTLNTSWYLLGHPVWKDGITNIIPPFYDDSPSYWEDPYMANGVTPHFWDSWHLFGLQFLRIGLNIWKFVVSSFQLSVFFIVIVGYAKWMLFWNRKTVLSTEMRLIMISSLLFTIGYLPINYEARYLWYMVPLAMVIGGLLIQRITENGLKNILAGLFALSFLVYPAWGLRKMYDVGKADHEIAIELRRMSVHGSFLSIVNPGKEHQQMQRVAYFSGFSYYCVRPAGRNLLRVLLPEMRRYRVNYYIIYAQSSYAVELTAAHFDDETGKPFPAMCKDFGKNGGMKIYTITPQQ
jgi:hypothetical protein